MSGCQTISAAGEVKGTLTSFMFKEEQKQHEVWEGTLTTEQQESLC